MLKEVVAPMIESQEDMTLVEPAEETLHLAGQVAETSADVLVVHCREDEIAALSQAVLDHKPQVRVISLVDRGRSGFLYWLRPEITPLGPLSPHVLLRAIRERPAPARTSRQEHESVH